MDVKKANIYGGQYWLIIANRNLIGYDMMGICMCIYRSTPKSSIFLSTNPIGSVCMPYMVTFTINIPQMLAYIPYIRILWVNHPFFLGGWGVQKASIFRYRPWWKHLIWKLYGSFLKGGYPHSWMVYFRENPVKRDEHYLEGRGRL